VRSEWQCVVKPIRAVAGFGHTHGKGEHEHEIEHKIPSAARRNGGLPFGGSGFCRHDDTILRSAAAKLSNRIGRNGVERIQLELRQYQLQIRPDVSGN
jgi:hypothetical protein